MVRNWHTVTRGQIVRWALVCAAVGVWPVSQVQAQLTQPSPDTRYITKAVAFLLTRDHLSKQNIDDQVAGRWLDRFVKMLDFRKMYFTKPDVERFQAESAKMDDSIRNGDVALAYDVFNTFLARVDERVKWVDELVKEPPDFTLEEEVVVDPDAEDFAANDADARERWRKRIKYEWLVLKTDDESSRKEAAEGKDKDRAERPPVNPPEKLGKRYHGFSKRMHQVDSDELLEMYLTALTTAYDPHTSYMSPRTLENFRIDMRLELDGIGAALTNEDGSTVVSKVVPGGAAQRDGRLKADDQVISVGQGPEGELVDVENMKLSDVVSLIRGKRGTIVRLEVRPGGTGEPKIYDITRDKITLADSEARSQIIETDHNGKRYRIGVIDLPSFYLDMEAASQDRANYKSTTRDVRRLLDDFRAQNIDGVVLDLRRNGGGSLTEAINLTGLFLDEGPIVQVKDAGGRILHYDDPERGVAWGGPLVVLTSKYSASASEILAGAIQDYHRGLVLGDESTHGKGTVQSLMPLADELRFARDLGALKITMQQFYRPSGDSTQNRGVVADVVLPSLSSHLPVGESDLDHSMAFDRVPTVNHADANMVTQSIVDQLRRGSDARRDRSEDFKRVERLVQRYEEQKDRKTVTLNEAKFVAEREELNAEREEEKELEEQLETDRPVFDEKDFYNQEVLGVTADYLDLLTATNNAVTETKAKVGQSNN